MQTQMLASRARVLAGVRHALTSVGDLLQALRESRGVFAEVLRADVSGDSIPHRPLPTVPPIVRDQTLEGSSPYRSTERDVHVYAVDDDVTTQAFVCDVLREEFGLNEARALFVMQDTHHRGLGFVGRFRFVDAVERVDRALARSHTEKMPFEIRLYPG